ncbi:hypothetical protein THAR02_03144 [Trichoderma harzianum]|uniref:Uncharacterized protein n=1 Tax=Trichoderma harzianum TaxID=5544 RepID=A0A0F9ZXK6_TRIHA|nr:hypothetical protein THAR02_03144 [Trichoderma harzianum]
MAQILVLSTRYPRSRGDIQATGPASSWNAADQRASVLGWAGLCWAAAASLGGTWMAQNAHPAPRYRASIPYLAIPNQLTGQPWFVSGISNHKKSDETCLGSGQPEERNYGDVGDGAAVKAEKF